MIRKIFNFSLIAYGLLLMVIPSTVSAVSPSGSPKVSASPKASGPATPSATPASTGKSIRDNLRERVEEKLNDLLNKPRAFVGKITQVSNSALTLETKYGIKQVKVTDKTVIIQTDAGKTKTIKEADLAVGNFVIAMGYVENKDTLSARRILMTAEDPLQARRPVYGVVQTASEGTFIVKHPNKSETWTVKTSTKTKVTAQIDGKMEKPTVDTIAVDDRIIAVGTPVKNGANTISAELIHVIPGEAYGLTKSPSPTASPKATKSPNPKPSSTPEQ